MEDNASVYKKVCILAKMKLGMTILKQSPNSPDLNSIENIWSYMKDIIGKDYREVSSVAEMKTIVRSMWENFKDEQ